MVELGRRIDVGWNTPEVEDPNANTLCALGLYIVGLDQGNTYGAFRSEIPAFMAYLNAIYGVALQPSAWLRSRGGYWGNLAADIPGFFDRIGALAPITDGRSYDPVGTAQSYTGDTSDLQAQNDYNAVPSVLCPTLPTAAGQSSSLLQQNALNFRAAAFASSGVPMMVAYGTWDVTVVPAVNIQTFAANYTEAGGTKLTLLPIGGADHGPSTMTLFGPLIDFMTRENAERSDDRAELFK